jgi:hypothetical protein
LNPVRTSIDAYSLYHSTKMIFINFVHLSKLFDVTVYKNFITLFDTKMLLTPLPGPNIPVTSLFLSTFIVADEKIPGVSTS